VRPLSASTSPACGRGKRLQPRVGHGAVTIVSRLRPEKRQALTFSATFGRDVNPMKTITVITVLALLTISGAVVSDQILTRQEHSAQATN